VIVNKRALGRTGIEVSEVSFGGVEIGIPYGIGVESRADMLDQAEAVKLLHAALDSGINFFDTARLYGQSEEIMGKAFKDRRDSVVICTKCKHLRTDTKQLPAIGSLRKIVDNSLKESLSALQTEYVDVYMIHDPNPEVIENQEIAEVFSEYRKKGLTRSIGVSTYTVEETRRAIESGIWDVIQLPFNLMDQRQGRLFPLARQRGVGVVVRSTLLKGVLTDKGRNLHPELKEVQQHRDLYNELLSDDVPRLSDLATKFVLSHNEVSSVLIGIDRMEYLQDALAVANGRYLDQKTLARAKELRYPDPEFLDLRRWDKMGWLR